MNLKLLLELDPKEDEEVWAEFPCPNCGKAPVPLGTFCQSCNCPGIVERV